MYFCKVIYNAQTAEYVLWINYLAPALSPLVSYPDVSICRVCCQLYVVVCSLKVLIKEDLEPS